MNKKTKYTLKSLLAVLCVFTLFVSNITFANAAVEPRYTGISTLTADLSISSSGKASCYGTVTPRSGYSVELTLELLQDGDVIKTWSDDGTSRVTLDKVYYVASGHDYQVVASVIVRNSNGVIVDDPVAESDVIHY